MQDFKDLSQGTVIAKEERVQSRVHNPDGNHVR
jgi:hypothetical protein